MKEILGDEDDPKVSQVRKRNARRKGCMDTILDGSFMGLVLVRINIFYCFVKVLKYFFFYRVPASLLFLELFSLHTKISTLPL
jgi:hypothetical protein